MRISSILTSSFQKEVGDTPQRFQNFQSKDVNPTHAAQRFVRIWFNPSKVTHISLKMWLDA